MNAETANPPIPDPSPDAFEPMTGEISLTNTFDTLLKKPGSLLYELNRDEGGDRQKLLIHLGITTVACLLVFGLVLGFFSGGNQLWAAPVKVVMGVLASAIITLPSLYIFSCLTGLDVNARTVGGVMAAAVCLISLLLVGLAPVAWIFAQSTDEIAFFGFLALGFWMVGMWFGLGLIFKAARWLGVKRWFHLGVWAIIFIVVTLQMSTALRPIIGESNRFLPTEKRFFLTHWFDHMDGDGVYEDSGWR